MIALLSTAVHGCGGRRSSAKAADAGPADAHAADDGGDGGLPPPEPLPPSEWLRTWGDGVGPGPGEDIGEGRALGVDGAGNVYVGGSVTGAVDLGEGRTAAGGGGYDAALVSLTAEGAFRWAIHFPGEMSQRVRSLSVGADRVAVVGELRGSMRIGARDHVARGSEDGFVAVLTADGAVLWSKAVGGDGFDKLTGVAVDGEGGVWVSGTFSESFDLEGTWLEANAPPATLVARYGPDGAMDRVRTFDNAPLASSLAVAPDGPYVAGTFDGTIDFAPDEVRGGEGRDVYLLALAPDASTRWIAIGSGFGDDFCKQVTLDSEGNPWITGDFELDLSFGATTLTAGSMTRDGFVAAFDRVDGMVQTAWPIAGDGGQSADALRLAPGGRVLVHGTFSEELAVGDGPPLAARGPRDVFVADFGSDGTFRWARHFGGASPSGAGDLAVGAAGELFVTGTAFGPMDFGGPTIEEAHDGVWFLLRLEPEP